MAPTGYGSGTVACRLAPSGRLAQVYRALYRGASGSEKCVKTHAARGGSPLVKSMSHPGAFASPVASGAHRPGNPGLFLKHDLLLVRVQSGQL